VQRKELSKPDDDRSHGRSGVQRAARERKRRGVEEDEGKGKANSGRRSRVVEGGRRGVDVLQKEIQGKK